MGIESVRVVDKEKNEGKGKDKRTYVTFKEQYSDKILKEKENTLNYTQNDVVLVNDKTKMENYYIYDQLMNVVSSNDHQIDNATLLINKYSNIFNKIEEPKEMNELEKKLIENHNEDIKEAYKSTHTNISFTGKITDKMVIGLGGHSVYETDLTLHHIYGVPYIPASTLKGAFRSYILNEYFVTEDNKESTEIEEEAMKDNLFRFIFGGIDKKGNSHQGRVVFMDSFPVKSYSIKSDIITSHHQDYYTKDKSLPLDNDDVNPISFLVVENTEFEFNIFIDKFLETSKHLKLTESKIFEKLKNNKNKLDEIIISELVESLTYQGVGGKTSIGYGYFDDIDKNKIFENLKLKKQKEQMRIEIEKKEKLKKLEEEKIRKETEDMTEVELKIYELEKMNDNEKHDELMKFFNLKFEKFNEEIKTEIQEKNKLANYFMRYLKDNKKWKVKNLNEDKKIDKKIISVCDFLKISYTKKK